MSRIFPVVGSLLAALAAAYVLVYRQPASAVYDGLPNHYSVSISPDAKTATVDADLWLDSDLLSLFNVVAVAGLEQGQADLIEDLQVSDASGRPLSVKTHELGDFEVGGGRRIHARYRVKLAHDDYAWPAGKEEVAYHTDEGLMATGYSLFLADGGDAMKGPIDVEFHLPPGWQAQTPWEAGATANRFHMNSRRELLNNAFFLGTAHTETLEAGGLELRLVLGQRYVPQAGEFADLLRRQLASYQQLFGAPPRGKRYLIIVNDDASGDGGAFSGSFSQFIAGDADAGNKVIWGYVMAHELLHFWNGLSLVPIDDREEWFKEGATDYLTLVTLARNGLIDQALLFKHLENLPRRYLIARLAQGLTMSVREAGKNKQANRQLVYGGGSLAALALDMELRKASADRVGLPQLMQALFSEFGGSGKPYQLRDIERVAKDLTGKDFRPFFARVVESGEYFDVHPALAALGLRLDSFLDEMYISPDSRADAGAKARFQAVFGPIAGD